MQWDTTFLRSAGSAYQGTLMTLVRTGTVTMIATYEAAVR